MCCVRWCRFAILLLFVSLLTTCEAQAPSAGGQSSAPAGGVGSTTVTVPAAVWKPTPENTYPQIVRLSYVEVVVERVRRQGVEGTRVVVDRVKAVGIRAVA